jgi:hypothetical protein
MSGTVVLFSPLTVLPLVVSILLDQIMDLVLRFKMIRLSSFETLRFECLKFVLLIHFSLFRGVVEDDEIVIVRDS